MYVQYGCGFCAPKGWINFDASPTLRFERFPVIGSLYTRNAQRFPANVRYGDIVKGLPIAPASCDGIYASHVLEHLSRADCMTALRNTRRYLKSSGLFRLVVPDLAKIATDYASHGDAHRFMRDSGLGRERHSIIRDALGNSAHLWLWDEGSMTAALRETGFHDVRRAQLNDSADAKFREVEDGGRFEGCLALEAQ